MVICSKDNTISTHSLRLSPSDRRSDLRDGGGAFLYCRYGMANDPSSLYCMGRIDPFSPFCMVFELCSRGSAYYCGKNERKRLRKKSKAKNGDVDFSPSF